MGATPRAGQVIDFTLHRAVPVLCLFYPQTPAIIDREAGREALIFCLVVAGGWPFDPTATRLEIKFTGNRDGVQIPPFPQRLIVFIFYRRLSVLSLRGRWRRSRRRRWENSPAKRDTPSTFYVQRAVTLFTRVRLR